MLHHYYYHYYHIVYYRIRVIIRLVMLVMLVIIATIVIAPARARAAWRPAGLKTSSATSWSACPRLRHHRETKQ